MTGSRGGASTVVSDALRAAVSDGALPELIIRTGATVSGRTPDSQQHTFDGGL